MTDPIAVTAGDRHGLMVFALDLPKTEIEHLIRPDTQPGKLAETPHDPLARLFGVAEIDHGYVEIIDPADLADLGLSGYLTEGNDIAEAEVAPDRSRLDALTGPVVLLSLKAFDGKATTLHPDPRLMLIGRYTEDRPPVHFEPLPTAATKGLLNPPLPPTEQGRLPGAFLLFGAALVLTGLAALFLALRRP